MKIFLIGFMGSGKTHWGKQLSEKLQLPFFDLDSVIEENEEKEITEIFAETGEEHFRLLEKDVLYLLTESHESFVMATGGGTPCFFNNIDYMKRRGTTVWINCSVECLHSRLAKEKEKRPQIFEGRSPAEEAAESEKEKSAAGKNKREDSRQFFTTRGGKKMLLVDEAPSAESEEEDEN